jgi:4'-phosphopantetheinyl transferase EntD
MIEEILPKRIAAVEAFTDSPKVALFPAEEAVVRTALERRRREFATGRDCAHRALEQIGRQPQAIPTGPRGQPQWPPGIVGSITHCTGYRACAVAEASDVAAIGIDAEPHEPVSDNLLAYIAFGEEIVRLRELRHSAPDIQWDRLLFSAKESVYKVWFPLSRCWLGFEDARVEIDPDEGTFLARLLVPGPSFAGGELTTLSGSWLVRDGLVLTAIALVTEHR